MSMFTRYKTIITPKSKVKIKAPAQVIDEVYNAGYYIVATGNRRYAQVFEYNKKLKQAKYIAPLSYFISDRVCGYKDGNGCNLVKSNLIMMED